MNYLLDTSICVFVIRKKSASVYDRLQQQSPGTVGISTLTLAELRFGADKSTDPVKNHAAIDSFVAPLQIVDFGPQAADEYGLVRSILEKHGTPIGAIDTLIAAHAMSLSVILVTNNVREFSKVTGLNVEDWSQRSGV